MSIIVADTSVVIKFLKVGRMDLLGAHPESIITTAYVSHELKTRFPEFYDAYQEALLEGHLMEEAVENSHEIALFLRLSGCGRIGRSECSALAVTLNRQHAIAVDGGEAIREAVRECGFQIPRVIQTSTIINELIHSGQIQAQEASLLRDKWRALGILMKIESAPVSPA